LEEEGAYVLVQRLRIPRDLLEDHDMHSWPFAVPCVRAVITEGLEFTAPVTFLVGENGSGKSTLVEAIAEAFGLDARGGRAGRKYGNDRPKTLLGQVARLDLTAAGAKMTSGSRRRRKGYFLRAETTFGLAEVVSGMHGYWDADLAEQSHGEGFMTIFDAMFQDTGLYLMDEPEAALSFTSCLHLIGLMHRLSSTGAQVICATHSPILAALPHADIIELGNHGLRRTTWDNLNVVDHHRRYLTDPRRYLRHILDT
jgi:predicted ATPase